MITQLRGRLVMLNPTSAVVDVGGVGYEVHIPLSSYQRLPKVGAEVRLLTALVHRDDQMTLYGFATDEERDLFRMLTGVSGIGPRVALTILSGIAPAQFREAVSQGDAKVLAVVRGIGPKLASRIVVELREQIGAAPAIAALVKGARKSETQQKAEDAVLALISLGYTRAAAVAAVRRVFDEHGEHLAVDEVVARGLKYV